MSSSETTATADKKVYLYDEPQNEDENLDSYDAVLFTAADVHGVPRGKFVFGDAVKTCAETGVEVPQYICAMGLGSERPTSIKRLNKTSQGTSLLKPDLSTLHPLSWLCTENRKVGHVLCDVFDSEGQPEISSARQVALRQIEALRNLGLQIMSAYEAEFTIFHKGTLDGLGGNEIDLLNLLKMDDQEHLYDQVIELVASGLPVETMMREFAPGQYELTFEPRYGIEMADINHRLRYATKSIAETAGLEVSFMSRPQAEFNGNGYHFNMSLWTLDGQNALLDPKRDHRCSALLHQWVAGIIHHASALTAIFCPTVNCYTRLGCFFAPADNVWNYDDRNASVRVKTGSSNVYFELRTPSSACNPYLVLAGVVAAGIDGIRSNMDPVPSREFRPLLPEDERCKKVSPVPTTLEESLDCLAKDTALKAALGTQFVDEYIALVKEHQLNKKELFAEEEKERYQAHRDMYLLAL